MTEADAVVAAIEAARQRICVKPPPRRAAQITIFDVLAHEEPLEEGCGQCGGWPPFGGCDECGRQPPPSGPIA